MGTSIDLSSFPTVVPIVGAERQKLVDHAGRTNKEVFRVVAGVFFGVAVIFAVLRSILRLKLRNKLFMDDYLVTFATLCLVVATSIYYHMTDWLYMIEAINIDARVVFTLSELMPLMEAMKWIDIWLAFIWTATFAIKLSFLVFFRPLIRAVSTKLIHYYWFTVAFTIVAWIFTVIEGFILCPHFGKDATKSK